VRLHPNLAVGRTAKNGRSGQGLERLTFQRQGGSVEIVIRDDVQEGCSDIYGSLVRPSSS